MFKHNLFPQGEIENCLLIFKKVLSLYSKQLIIHTPLCVITMKLFEIVIYNL